MVEMGRFSSYREKSPKDLDAKIYEPKCKGPGNLTAHQHCVNIVEKMLEG